MGDEQAGRKSSGCGLLLLYNKMFRRSSSSASSSAAPPAVSAKLSSASNSKRRRSDEASLLGPARPSDAPISKAAALNQMLSPVAAPYHQKPRKQQDSIKPMPATLKRMQSNGLTAELDSMIHDHQRSKASSTLIRASSGNVMLFGNLGNIRAPGAVSLNPPPPKKTPAVVAPRPKEQNDGGAEKESASMCRALSRRLEPEELKAMGNEEYSKGRYAEAIGFYERAILINPNVASYYSNKAAALMGLGQFLEAVIECQEAIKIDPSYSRAHHRLASLYLRLGEGDKATRHYKSSTGESKANDIVRAQALQSHLNKCNEARRLRDWNTLLKEAKSAVAAGADAAPKVFASQAEALLLIHKHEEAESVLIDAPKYNTDASTKFFGASTNAYVLAVQAQVHMAAGRFDDAIAVAQKAAQLDPSNRDASTVARKARVMASARAKGNDFFKASKYEEACAAYGEGLAHDSHNAILLCNRAACRSKIGDLEKAIDDCNAALKVRPSYAKASLRRADCNAKLERWEASIEDYEALLHYMPGDEEIIKALAVARAQLKEQDDEA